MCCTVQVLLLTDPGTNYSFQVFLQIRKILPLKDGGGGRITWQRCSIFCISRLDPSPPSQQETFMQTSTASTDCLKDLSSFSAPPQRTNKQMNIFLWKGVLMHLLGQGPPLGASVAHSTHTHILFQKSSELAQPLLASWMLRLVQWCRSSLVSLEGNHACYFKGRGWRWRLTQCLCSGHSWNTDSSHQTPTKPKGQHIHVGGGKQS